VLDDVERRRFFVDPPREDPVPALVRPLHVKLYEGAGQLLVFPRRGRLASAQAHDRVVHPNRLARLQSQIPDYAVALVEETEHRDALGHGGDARLLARARVGAGQARAVGLLRLIAAAAACQEQQQYGAANRGNSQSGFHAW
jgi:hypothetical protein